jgi:hypothetical protein
MCGCGDYGILPRDITEAGTPCSAWGAAYRTLDKKELSNAGLPESAFAGVLELKCVLSAPVGCILAAAYLVRENLIVDDRAGNRSVLIAMLVNRRF